jgi:hypothetical protein
MGTMADLKALTSYFDAAAFFDVDIVPLWWQCIIGIIKAKRMSWAGHVARMDEIGTRIGCWWEGQREGGH